MSFRGSWRTVPHFVRFGKMLGARNNLGRYNDNNNNIYSYGPVVVDTKNKSGRVRSPWGGSATSSACGGKPPVSRAYRFRWEPFCCSLWNPGTWNELAFLASLGKDSRSAHKGPRKNQRWRLPGRSTDLEGKAVYLHYDRVRGGRGKLHGFAHTSPGEGQPAG